MTEMQKMIDGTFGPTRAHYDDLVVSEEGLVIMHGEAFMGCKGNAYCNEEDRDEADLTIVEDILDGMVKWSTEYCTENDDYASGYDHVVSELSHEWPDRVKEWVNDAYADWKGHSKFDDCLDKLVGAMCDDLDGAFDCELEFDHNEYAAYSGSGCCLFSFDIGEVEEQIDITNHDEFADLHAEGRLRGLLELSNCDAYVNLSDYSLRGDCPCFEFYHSPGGQWRYVVCKERMEQALTTAIIGLCRG